MSLSQKDLVLIRSMPYPHVQTELDDKGKIIASKEQPHVERAIINVTKYFFEKHPERLGRTIKAIQKGIKMGMQLPIYIKPLDENGNKLVLELLDLLVNDDRQEEREKYYKEATELEKAQGRMMIFLDKLYTGI